MELIMLKINWGLSWLRGVVWGIGYGLVMFGRNVDDVFVKKLFRSFLGKD